MTPQSKSAAIRSAGRYMSIKELNERVEKYLKENGPKVIREYEENGVRIRVFERV